MVELSRGYTPADFLAMDRLENAAHKRQQNVAGIRIALQKVLDQRFSHVSFTSRKGMEIKRDSARKTKTIGRVREYIEITAETNVDAIVNKTIAYSSEKSTAITFIERGSSAGILVIKLEP